MSLPGILFRKTSLVPYNRIGYNERRHEQCKDRGLRKPTACRRDYVRHDTCRAKSGHQGRMKRYRDEHCEKKAAGIVDNANRLLAGGIT